MQVWTFFHAIESYVSVMADDYTRGLPLQAIKLVLENLEHSCRFGDEESREKMHKPSTMARYGALPMPSLVLVTH